MPEQSENSMVVDGYWNEIEYGVPFPSSNRLRREREVYEQAEREENIWN